uniref:Uncharacterized protein n=1 Tax=Schistosoma mansoni TaxID=6183 RepID=A0A5K4F9G1_SCHMA
MLRHRRKDIEILEKYKKLNNIPSLKQIIFGTLKTSNNSQNKWLYGPITHLSQSNPSHSAF